MKFWFLLLTMALSVTAWSGEPITLDDLHGTMDRATLEAVIAAADRAPATDPQRAKRLGIAWHNLAVQSVSGAADKAKEWLLRAREAAPEDPEVWVYLGSADTMVARDSWNVVIKVSQVNKGANLIDKAVRRVPDSVVVRMVRANNSLALPEFFGRRPVALEDLTFLHDGKGRPPMKPDTAAEVSFKLGEMRQAAGDKAGAQALFAEARKQAPDSVWAQRAAAQR